MKKEKKNWWKSSVWAKKIKKEKKIDQKLQWDDVRMRYWRYKAQKFVS